MITHTKRINLIAMLPNHSKVAEVGVYRGYFSAEMLNLTNLAKLWLIDPWAPLPAYDDPLSNTDHEDNYDAALESIGGHFAGGRVEIIRATSLQARYLFPSPFPEELLDAVYIDANHSYDSVLQDLLAWEPKIKHGGFLMGHDACDRHPTAIEHGWGVEMAIAKFCKERGWELTHKTSEEFPSFALQRI